MKGLRNIFLVVLVLGVCNSLFAITIIPNPLGDGIAEAGEALGPAFAVAIQRRKEQTNVTETKALSIASWVGGQKKICRKCYEENLELKKRVELTALIALQLQGIGYSLQDSVETAKTAVVLDMGNCEILHCQ